MNLPRSYIRFREWAGLHRPEDGLTAFGPRRIARCRDCHRRIFSDQNGGWFPASVQPIERDQLIPTTPHPGWLDE